MLEVDAVVFGNFVTSEPLSAGAAGVLKALKITYADEGYGVIQIADAASGILLYRYKLVFSATTPKKSKAMIELIMKKSAKKLPYLSG